MSDFSAHRTVAIILGAKDFSRAGLGSDPAFEVSAEALRGYFLREGGLHLPTKNVLFLFDDDRGPDQLDHAIEQFLEARAADLRDAGFGISDVIVYYTGHGAFAPGDDYFLALRATRKTNVASSGYRIVALAATLKEHARNARRFVILDCCFAASAYKGFMSPVLDVVIRQSSSAFPKRGTALLCASSQDRPARSRTKDGATPSGMTLFSECLYEVLSRGVAGVENGRLSLGDVGAAVEELMRDRYDAEGPRPEVKSPDERDGDVSKHPLFPNVASGKTAQFSEATPSPTSAPPRPAKPIALSAGERPAPTTTASQSDNSAPISPVLHDSTSPVRQQHNFVAAVPEFATSTAASRSDVPADTRAKTGASIAALNQRSTDLLQPESPLPTETTEEPNREFVASGATGALLGHHRIQLRLLVIVILLLLSSGAVVFVIRTLMPGGSNASAVSDAGAFVHVDQRDAALLILTGPASGYHDASSLGEAKSVDGGANSERDAATVDASAHVESPTERKARLAKQVAIEVPADHVERRRIDRELLASAKRHGESGSLDLMLAEFDEWRRHFSRTPGNEGDYVQTFFDSAEAFYRAGRDREAVLHGDKTFAAWEATGGVKNALGSQTAARWQFEKTERIYKGKFRASTFKAAKTLEEAKKAKGNLEQLLTSLMQSYSSMIDFDVKEYTIAGMVRMAEAEVEFGVKLRTAPTPLYVLELDRKSPGAGVVEAYAEALRKETQKYFDHALLNMDDAIRYAKRKGYSGEWLDLAEKRANLWGKDYRQ